MVSSRTEDVSLATQWIAHFESTWAWDDMNEIIEREPERAWRLIKAMVAYAPDYGTVAAVAAGPVEDLLQSPEWLERAVTEAKVDPRLRSCLRATYLDLPPELGQSAGDEKDLPTQTSLPTVNPDELKLIVGWFHHHDTHPASTLVEGIIDRHPEQAAVMIEMLLRLVEEKTALADDVLLFAVDPFVRKHFATHHDFLVRLATNNVAVRDWVMTQRRAVSADDSAWQEFVRDVASV